MHRWSLALGAACCVSMLLLGTDHGLYSFDASGEVTEVIADRPVSDVAGRWAVVDGSVVLDVESGAATDLGLRVDCIQPLGDGYVAGTEQAHLYRDGEPIESFDAIPTRDEWYTPWGAPADVRSLAVAPDTGALLVNVHVGGVWLAEGDTWREVIAVEDDTHQVLALGSGRALVAAAVGFGWSGDGGASWRWTTNGLHASYSRAVACSATRVFVTSSDGPFTKRGVLYSRLLSDESAAFEPCGGGLPESFPFNIDTRQVAARDRDVAVGTADGRLFVSSDEADTWTLAARDLPPIRAITLHRPPVQRDCA